MYSPNGIEIIARAGKLGSPEKKVWELLFLVNDRNIFTINCPRHFSNKYVLPLNSFCFIIACFFVTKKLF